MSDRSVYSANAASIVDAGVSAAAQRWSACRTLSPRLPAPGGSRERARTRCDDREVLLALGVDVASPGEQDARDRVLMAHDPIVSARQRGERWRAGLPRPRCTR